MPASLSLQPAGPTETAMGFATIGDVSTVQCLASRAAMRADRSLAVADERQTPSKSAKAVACATGRASAPLSIRAKRLAWMLLDAAAAAIHANVPNREARTILARETSPPRLRRS